MAEKGDAAPPLPDLMHPKDVAFRLSRSRGFVYKLVSLGALEAAPLGTGPRAALGITRASYEAYLARVIAEGRQRFGPAA